MVWVFPKKRGLPPRYQCEALWIDCKFWDLSKDNWILFDPETETLGYLDLSCRVKQDVDIFPLLSPIKDYFRLLDFPNKIVVFDANKKSFCLGVQSSECRELMVSFEGVLVGDKWEIALLILGTCVSSKECSGDSIESIKHSVVKLIRIAELYRSRWGRNHADRNSFEI
jgi:hypothetical protein